MFHHVVNRRPGGSATRSRSLAARRRSRPIVDRLEGREMMAADFPVAVGIAGTVFDGLAIRGTATDSAGNVFVTGSFNGTVDFDPSAETTNLVAVGSSPDIVVAKYSSAGALIWARGFGSTGADEGNGLAVDPAGAVYVTGLFRETVDFNPGPGVNNLVALGHAETFVLKLDANGNFGYALQGVATVGDNEGLAIAVDPTGAAYLTGRITSPTTFGTSVLAPAGLTGDAFVAKVNAAGTGFAYARSFATAGVGPGGVGYGIAVDATGGAVAVGEFSGLVDFDPSILGIDHRGSAGGTDVFIVKLTPGGELAWADTFGGPGLDQGLGVALDVAGNVYTTGKYIGSVDFDPGPGAATISNPILEGIFVAKHTAAGAYAAAVNVGVMTGTLFDPASNFTSRSALAVDARGNLYVAATYINIATLGGITLPPSIGEDVFLARLRASDLGVVDAAAIQSPGIDTVNGLAINHAGGVSMVGRYLAPAMLGGTTLPGTGLADNYLVRVTLGPQVAHAPANDYDGDGRSDLSIFDPSTATWVAQLSSGGTMIRTFGAGNLAHIPVSGDYDGDGRTDLAIFDPASATWVAQLSSGGTMIRTFGAPRLFHIPVPGDYDGDGKTDLAIFEPSTATWVAQLSGGGTMIREYGATNLVHIPVPGDYDGDGTTDLAVFESASATWIAQLSGGGTMIETFGAGKLVHIPVPGDYDGDGKTDLAIFDPASATWVAHYSCGGSLIRTFGAGNLVHIPLGAPVGSLMKLGILPRRSPAGQVTSSRILVAEPSLPLAPALTGTSTVKKASNIRLWDSALSSLGSA